MINYLSIIKNIGSRNYLIVGTSFFILLNGCSKSMIKDGDSEPGVAIITNYENGNSKTLFYLKYGRVSDSLFLYDSSGNLEIKCAANYPILGNKLKCFSDSA